MKTSTVDWKPIKTKKTPSGNNKLTPGKTIFLGLMIAMPVISFYLGTWQMRRLKWKTNLIATCEDRLTYPPVPLPKNFTPDMCDGWEYRKVTVKGEFKHDQEIFVGPRVRNGVKGYFLFTPFVRKDTGEKLLIERGWISEEKVYPQSRHLQHLSLPQGSNVEVECLVRVPRKLGTFQWERENKDGRLWQVADIEEMCKVTGCTPIHIQALYDLKDHRWEQDHPGNDTQNQGSSVWKFWNRNKGDVGNKTSTEAESEEGSSEEFNQYQFVKAGVPLGKAPKIDLKNNHLQYLVTWYGLSFLSSIFLFIALKRGRGGAITQAQMKQDKLKHAKRFM